MILTVTKCQQYTIQNWNTHPKPQMELIINTFDLIVSFAQAFCFNDYPTNVFMRVTNLWHRCGVCVCVCACFFRPGILTTETPTKKIHLINCTQSNSHNQFQIMYPFDRFSSCSMFDCFLNVVIWNSIFFVFHSFVSF